MKVLFKLVLIIVFTIIISCNSNNNKATGQVPTKDDIINVMKATWEKKATQFEPKVTITVNNLIIGSSAKANYAEELDGIPKDALVTAAKMDFTANTYNLDGIHTTRRIMTLSVYRNKFNEWEAMNTETTYPQ